MPRYNYTVVSTDGKKLNGTIESPDIDNARKDLNSLGFSVVAINEMEEGKTIDSKNILFEFEAIDPKGKKVVGTIPAQEKYLAYKRLVQEYEFIVLSLCKAASTPYEKNQEKEEGLDEFKEKLRKEQKQDKKTGEINLTGNDEEHSSEEQALLKEQIDFVLQKVTDLMQRYSAQMAPEDRQEVNNQVNKLLRIKNSSNLEYVRKSSEELLKTIQNQEVLMFNTENDFHKSKLKYDVNKLLNDIHKNKENQSWRENAIQKLEKLINKLVAANNGSQFSKIKIKLANYLLSLFKESDEVRALKRQYHTLKGQINDYLKMYIKESNPEIKKKIKANISGLLETRKSLKLQIKNIKKAEKEIKDQEKSENFLRIFSNELYTFSGWLLSFYLIYYFIGIYLNTKSFGLEALPKNMSIYQSTFFKYIFAILFMVHSSLSLKINFFKNSTAATLSLLPITIITIILIMFNL